MAKKIENLLKRLFDYQKFEQNFSLKSEINSVFEKNKDFLLDDSTLLAVAGGKNNPDIKDKKIEKEIK